jgi:uncharacterized membrane protein
MKDKIVYEIIAVLSLICLMLAIVIYIENIQISSHKQDICSAITGTSGCETVQTSKYSKLFGISNTIYGITGFALLEIFALFLIFGEHKKRYLKAIRFLTMLGGMIAGLAAILFLYLQTIVIHAYCIFCIFVDVSSLIILGLTIYLIIKSRHK